MSCAPCRPAGAALAGLLLVAATRALAQPLPTAEPDILVPRGVAVAVVDMGVDHSHPSLAGRVGAEACFLVLQEGVASDALCPGGVVLPTGDVFSTGPGAALCSDRSDDCQHGTVVAGLIASAPVLEGDRIGPGVEIVVVRAGSGGGMIYPSSVLRALTWLHGQVLAHEATGMGPQIVAINLSFGLSELFPKPCDDHQRLTEAQRLISARIRELRRDGLMVFAAAGNVGNAEGLIWPACSAGAIAVGAIEEGDRVAFYSSRDAGIGVDLYAPGDGRAAGFALQGTSMAAAAASGSYALVRGAFLDDPGIDAEAVLAALQRSGRPIRDPTIGVTSRAADAAAAHRLLRAQRASGADAPGPRHGLTAAPSGDWNGRRIPP